MLPPATWYPDPSGRHEHRYWDGRRWTQHVADAGIASIDPFEDRTADEQVDGGVAADIAAVALARTTTHDPAGSDEQSGPDDAGAGPDGRGEGSPTRPLVVCDLDEPWVPTVGALDAQVRGRAVRMGMRLPGPSVVAAVRAVRRTVGTIDHDPTEHGDLRHLVGDGSVTLVGDQPVRLVAVVADADLHVRRDVLVAADGAAVVHAVPPVDGVTAGDGPPPPAVLHLRAARWVVLGAGPELHDVTVTADGVVRHAVAWVGHGRLTADSDLVRVDDRDGGTVHALQVPA